jgi:hypothetical protein
MVGTQEMSHKRLRRNGFLHRCGLNLVSDNGRSWTPNFR